MLPIFAGGWQSFVSFRFLLLRYFYCNLFFFDDVTALAQLVVVSDVCGLSTVVFICKRTNDVVVFAEPGNLGLSLYM